MKVRASTRRLRFALPCCVFMFGDVCNPCLVVIIIPPFHHRTCSLTGHPGLNPLYGAHISPVTCVPVTGLAHPRTRHGCFRHSARRSKSNGVLCCWAARAGICGEFYGTEVGPNPPPPDGRRESGPPTLKAAHISLREGRQQSLSHTSASSWCTQLGK